MQPDIYRRIFSGVTKSRRSTPPHESLDSIAAQTVDADDFDESGSAADGNSDIDHLGRVAAALQLAHPGLSKETAYRWLIHSAHGRALTRHLYKRAVRNGRVLRKGQTEMTTHSALLKAINDSDGVIALAKHMVATYKSHGMSERDFSDALMVHARKHKRAGESDAGAFSRILCAQDDDGIALRKALQLCKAGLAPVDATPVYVGGDTARDAADGSGDAQRAYAQLETLGERLRSQFPELRLTKAQAFARAFEENPELAQRAHKRPGPTTSFPFPR